MYTYLLVFQYTKNGNLYVFNKTIMLGEKFSVDDIENQEKIAHDERDYKCWLVNVVPLHNS